MSSSAVGTVGPPIKLFESESKQDETAAEVGDLTISLQSPIHLKVGEEIWDLHSPDLTSEFNSALRTGDSVAFRLLAPINLVIDVHGNRADVIVDAPHGSIFQQWHLNVFEARAKLFTINNPFHKPELYLVPQKHRGDDVPITLGTTPYPWQILPFKKSLHRVVRIVDPHSGWVIAADPQDGAKVYLRELGHVRLDHTLWVVNNV